MSAQPKPTDEVTELRIHSKSLTKEEVELMNLHSETVERLTKPTGEWTNVDVEDLWEKGGSIAVKEAHNAALAAEENKRADWNYVIEELEKQLADEREASRYWKEQWVERGAQLAAHKQQAESMLATSSTRVKEGK